MISMRVKKMMRTQQGVRPLDVDFKIETGEFLTLFGESGAGKTTLLRMLAGLTSPEEGAIVVQGETWFDSHKKINLPVERRKVGFVFEDPSLFPNMTVRQNLAYACADKNQRGVIEEWLKIMDLKALENASVNQLSGGQKQRVALARALVSCPKILLLDEPLSALDLYLRLKLQDEIVAITQKTKITTILVSHDIAEVFKLSGKIFVIDQGRIIKSGNPREIFVNNNLSGKFKFTGEIIEINKDGVLNILTVRIANTIAKVVATDEEIIRFKIGTKVILATKAFNPLILECEGGRHPA